jgi:hypothetical protein
MADHGVDAEDCPYLAGCLVVFGRVVLELECHHYVCVVCVLEVLVGVEFVNMLMSSSMSLSPTWATGAVLR